MCADIASLYQFRASWEKEIKAEVNGCKGLFLDIGANIGFYSVMAAKNGNPVIALEPNPKAFEALMLNAKNNKVENLVQTYNMAAWSKTEPLRLAEGRHTDISKVSNEGTAILGLALDDLVNGQIPYLIKIDAEGSEPEILAGLKRTLQQRPRIIFEALNDRKFSECLANLPGFYYVKALDRTNYLAS